MVFSRFNCSRVSTHSRPKAAGTKRKANIMIINVSTHSRPKAAGYTECASSLPIGAFQHTAARRRLGNRYTGFRRPKRVSTHSRPKAAG